MGLTDSARQQAEEYFQKGLELERKGASVFAMKCFEKAAMIDPLRYGEYNGIRYFEDERAKKASMLIKMLGCV